MPCNSHRRECYRALRCQTPSAAVILYISGIELFEVCDGDETDGCVGAGMKRQYSRRAFQTRHLHTSCRKFTCCTVTAMIPDSTIVRHISTQNIFWRTGREAPGSLEEVERFISIPTGQERFVRLSHHVPRQIRKMSGSDVPATLRRKIVP